MRPITNTWAIAKSIRFPHKMGLVKLLDYAQALVDAKQAPHVPLIDTAVSVEYSAAEVQAIQDRLDMLLAAMLQGGLMATPLE